MACGFASAGVVGAARRIVALRAGKPQGTMRTGKLKGDTVPHPKVVKAIVMLKGDAGCIGRKKPWLIGLQYRSPPDL
ncbi:MAG: hypothetical protein M0Z81_17635 [Deltaproteobacteria bacterium]|nr:hypothetical protein [Deltaproteobacteria bacterium]